jgi:type IV pilus assembly protein PilB
MRPEDPVPGRKPLGQRLLERGLVTARQLDLALREQKRTRALLGETLLQLGFVTARAVASTLAEQGGVPFLELAELDIPADALALVPEAAARRLRVLPLGRDRLELRLAMANIFDLEALAEIERLAGLRVAVVCAGEDDLLARLAQAYGEGRTMEAAIEEAIRLAGDSRAADPAELPISGLVQQLLLKAVRDRATDLHLQPEARTVLTRFRVDGALAQGPSLPKDLQPALLARLKVMAEVDIAESRRPQDGKFQLPAGRRVFDVRASFLPARHGEKAVLRFMDKTSLVLGLDQLGMPEWVLGHFTAMLERPHGMVLVTGPTGSGKTTTLYSAINRLNSPDRCIVTVEDPVEYELPLVTQVPVSPRAERGFAASLRAILRQDPDIILVGEVRDAETAAIALRAAMTGHLVLTTLHAGDPVGAIPRLKDLGLSSLELASTVLGIQAQRLVRLNCAACSVACQPEAAALARVQEPGRGRWMKGAGCRACAGTGIRGRRAVHDLLPVTPQVRERIARGAGLEEIEAQARVQGKGSLRQHALALAREGLITLEEALRVTVADT